MPKQKNQFDFPQAELEVDEKVKPMKISKRVMAIGKRNGLKPNEIVGVQAYVTNGFKKKPAYALTHPAQKATSATANCHKMFNKPAVVKSIEEILSDNRISTEKILLRHNDIIEEARAAGQYGTALAGNKDFFSLTGIEKLKDNTTNNIFILGNGEANQKKIDELLFGQDYIEGEVL